MTVFSKTIKNYQKSFQSFNILLSCHHSSGQNKRFLRAKTFSLVHMDPPSLKLFSQVFKILTRCTVEFQFPKKGFKRES